MSFAATQSLARISYQTSGGRIQERRRVAAHTAARNWNIARDLAAESTRTSFAPVAAFVALNLSIITILGTACGAL